MLGLVAGPVIEAIARLEFEDGLRTEVLPGDSWCHLYGFFMITQNINPIFKVFDPCEFPIFH